MHQSKHTSKMRPHADEQPQFEAPRRFEYVFDGDDETDYTHGDAIMVGVDDGNKWSAAMLFTLELSRNIQASLLAKSRFEALAQEAIHRRPVIHREYEAVCQYIANAVEHRTHLEAEDEYLTQRLANAKGAYHESHLQLDLGLEEVFVNCRLLPIPDEPQQPTPLASYSEPLGDKFYFQTEQAHEEVRAAAKRARVMFEYDQDSGIESDLDGYAENMDREGLAAVAKATDEGKIRVWMDGVEECGVAEAMPEIAEGDEVQVPEAEMEVRKRGRISRHQEREGT